MKTKLVTFMFVLTLIVSCGKDEGSDARSSINNTANTTVTEISATMVQLRDYFEKVSLAKNTKIGETYQFNTLTGTINFNTFLQSISLRPVSTTNRKITSANASEIKFKEGQNSGYLDSYPEQAFVKSDTDRVKTALAQVAGKSFRLYVAKMFVNGTLRDVQVVERRVGTSIKQRHIFSKDVSYMANPLCSFDDDSNNATLVSTVTGSTGCDTSVFGKMVLLSEEAAPTE